VRSFTTTFAVQKHQPLAPARQPSMLEANQRPAAIMVQSVHTPTAVVPKVTQPRIVGPRRRRKAGRKIGRSTRRGGNEESSGEQLRSRLKPSLLLLVAYAEP